uniref:3-deoxy-7-phosphoheptulonate synthase n=1 Tax=mine drainage metagenome TaxID=410659 RepID=E6QNE4_9ZZZZ
MILILNPNVDEQSAEYRQLLAQLAALPGIQTRVHVEHGNEQKLTEM